MIPYTHAARHYEVWRMLPEPMHEWPLLAQYAEAALTLYPEVRPFIIAMYLERIFFGNPSLSKRP